MSHHVSPIPEGYHTVTPYLIVEGAAGLIGFVAQAFGAQVRLRMDRPDGTVTHAEVQIGDTIVMLADATDQWPARPGTLMMYVEDVDAVYRAAMEAGAQSVMTPEDTYHGDRMGGVVDPCGNQWWIAARIEDLSAEELVRREAERGRSGA